MSGCWVCVFIMTFSSSQDCNELDEPCFASVWCTAHIISIVLQHVLFKGWFGLPPTRCTPGTLNLVNHTSWLAVHTLCNAAAGIIVTSLSASWCRSCGRVSCHMTCTWRSPQGDFPCKMVLLWAYIRLFFDYIYLFLKSDKLHSVQKQSYAEVFGYFRCKYVGFIGGEFMTGWFKADISALLHIKIVWNHTSVKIVAIVLCLVDFTSLFNDVFTIQALVNCLYSDLCSPGPQLVCWLFFFLLSFSFQTFPHRVPP